MTREKFIPSFILMSALALPLVACSGGEGDDDDTTPAGSATPTATAAPTAVPTPTPTAVPAFDKWQAFTSFAVAGQNEGLDYDGNGSPDNGLYAAFDVIVESLVTSVSDTIDGLTDYPNQTDPCEGTDTGCLLTPPQAQAAKVAAQTAIEGAISVESINNALAAPYTAGLQPQAINVVEEGNAFGLYYYSGAAVSGGWTPEEQIGYQPGNLQTSGVSEFGKGSFYFGTEVGGGPGGGTATPIGFEVKDALTTFTWNAASISGARTGGGIEIVALTNLVVVVLDALDEAGALPEDFDKQGAIDAVETALVANSDITCTTSNEPCFSVTFKYNASATTPK